MFLHKHQYVLYLSALVALVTHIGGILWLRHLDINYQMPPSHAQWENQTARYPELSEASDLKEEKQRKNEQLAALFKEISRPASETQSLQHDTKAMPSEMTLPGMEKMQTQVKLQELFEVDSSPDSEQLKLTVEEPSKVVETALRKQTHVDVLFPQDRALTDELILATEKALGDVEMPLHEPLDSYSSMRTGAQEGSLLGASSQNRSGLIDQGLVDSSASTRGSLMLAAEIGSMLAQGRESLQGVGQNLLPTTPRDGMRGFDYSTMGTIASSDDFNLSIEYAPRLNGQGFVFRLQLMPKPGVRFKRIVQNVYFLIDRSHSIRKQRYDLTKQAVITMLSLLNQGDTFNILVFDDKMVRFSAANVPVTPANIVQARDFLLKQEHGGLFAATDLYSSLGNIVPAVVAETEVNTAILFSDGDTFLNSDKQRDNIARWTRQNGGKVSLFSVASGKNNNLVLMDVLSVLNKGTLYYATTDRGVESELLKLMLGIRNPIGKEIFVTAVAASPQTTIKIYPIRAFAPNLYENIPYEIYGTIDTLSDFHVFLQGKYYDKSLDIKQTVTFGKASRSATADLEKTLSQQMAYESYDRYLKDGHPALLTYIKQLLSPYKIPVAFQ